MAISLGMVGALIGVLLLEAPGGLVMGALLGWLLGWVIQLRRQMEQLRTRLQQLEGQQTPTGSDPVARQPTSEPVEDEAARAPEPALEPAVEETTAAPQEPQPDEPVFNQGAWQTSNAGASASGKPDWLTSLGHRIRDYLVGGNVVLRVGLVVLFFGLSFLLKYSVDQALLPIEFRLAAVALGGIVMIGVGYWLSGSRWLYGVLLQGGGVGVMYLTVFTALRLYELMPPGLAFALLVALSVLFAALAILQDARGLAAFAAGGGFMAPVLASTGEGSHVLLFGYYAVLNAGIVGIAYFRAWRELNLIAFMFTFVIATAWGVASYEPAHYASTQPFLILFFLFFVALPVLFARQQPPRLKQYIDGTLVFGVPLVGFGLQAAMLEDYPLRLAFSALAVAALYVALATALWRREGMRPLAEAFLALGVVFITLAIPLALDSQWTAAVWALEGAGLIWVGCRQDRLLPRVSGLLLQFGAGMSFVIALLSANSWGDVPVLNGLYLGCLIISLSAFASGWLMQRESYRWAAAWSRVLLAWGLMWWLGGGLAEIERQVGHDWFVGTALLFLSASAVALALFSRRLVWLELGYPAMGLWPVALLAALAILEDHPNGHFLAGGGWLGWAGFFAAHLVLLKHARWPESWLRVSHSAGFCLLVLFLAVELGWLVSGLGSSTAPGAWTAAAWGLMPALAILAMGSDRPDHLWPVAASVEGYRGPGLYPVIGGSALWLIAAYSHPGGASPLPYMPVLNPLDLVQALLPAAVALWWYQTGYRFLGEKAAKPMLSALGMAGFLWLNTVLARAVHHWGGISYTPEALFQSGVLQSALAVAWGLSAMLVMGMARSRMSRVLWLVGAALLGLTVAKLFLIDLAESGTVTRIISFMGVGLLMLLIGYMAPLPPERSREST
ncbi:DUF2339 domain-containing protein [Halomonadaceae bacterium KBTZ08]